MEELSDQYTIEAVDPLFRLAWDKDIDLDHKLRSLYAIHRNFQLVLQRLRCQHEEQARVKSNEWRHLADASEQLRADLEPATTGERRYPDWFLA